MCIRDRSDYYSDKFSTILMQTATITYCIFLIWTVLNSMSLLLVALPVIIAKVISFITAVATGYCYYFYLWGTATNPSDVRDTAMPKFVNNTQSQELNNITQTNNKNCKKLPNLQKDIKHSQNSDSVINKFKSEI